MPYMVQIKWFKKQTNMKIFYTSIILFLSLSLSAQITFTNDNLAPEGTTFYFSKDTIPDASIEIGEPGADKVWDFTALIEHELDTMVFSLPDWTPYPDSFPDANFAIESVDDSGYVYMVRNDEMFKAIGVVGLFGDFGVLSAGIDPEEIVYDFPVQYGNSRDESFSIQITLESNEVLVDSVRIKKDTDKNVMVDAWGSLILPMGTYQTLRIKDHRTEYDSTWALIFGNWTLISSEENEKISYSWLTNDPTIGYELVTLKYNAENQTVSRLNFLNSTPVGMEEIIAMKTAFAFPNPTLGKLSIEFEDAVKGSIQIYNLRGKLLLQMPVDGNVFETDLSAAEAGTYFYRVFNEDGKAIYGGKLIKQ